MDLHLVEPAGLQQRVRCARAVHHDGAVARRARASAAHSTTSVQDLAVPGSTSPSSTAEVSTRTGTPPWWSPFQRPASSKVRRPEITALVARTGPYTCPARSSGPAT
ncbi:hypothetical protein [Geodermatophilus amargosae]|uniref:hypothetical protein n=1 Tax=Geodermatophilus amargosae TaxID=1296565 RepID=UPI0015876B7E|nr:hypothetical protein [Geodermatophilus amargosae]